MFWSFTLAKIAGIPIKIHTTFFLVLILGAFQWATRSGEPVAGALFGVTLMILLFACVLLHELGHSLAARSFGIPTSEILLMPLGGVAQLQKMPSKPWQELVVAAAGPLVNVVIAFLLLLVIGISPTLSIADLFMNGQGLPASIGNDISLQNMIFWLLAANVSLVLFNLIPAFPLDGGRILRALLAMVIGDTRATRIASLLGQGIAIALAVWGVLSGNLMLVLVAVFVFIGAGQERSAGRARPAIDARQLGEVYNRHAIVLQNGDRLSKVTDYILGSYQPDFAVMFGNRLLGTITRDDVLRTLASQPTDVYVGEFMRRDPLRLQHNMSLEDALAMLQEKRERLAVVQDGDQILGLVSREDIQEAVAVFTFTHHHRKLRARMDA